MNSSGHQKAGLGLYSQGGLGVTRIERSAGFNETKEALRDALDSEGVEGIIKVLVDRGFDEQNLCEYVEVISSDSIEGSALSAPNVREFLARRYEAALESISSQARNVLMLWERFKKKNN